MRLESVRKTFGAHRVLDGITLEIDEGKVTAILGPSGCGKTTLMRICAGLIEPDDPPSTELSQLRTRPASFLFQEPRLLPWESACGNVELVLHKLKAGERRERAMRFLDSVGLTSFGDYRPDALSGGMKQRVAMARSFAFSSDVLYMDEPYQGLDLELKLSLIEIFRRLQSAFGARAEEVPAGGSSASNPRTVIFVTHDVSEAVLLGDRIYVLSRRPAQVRGELRNPVPPDERSLRNRALRDLEGKLYDMILDSPSGEVEEDPPL